MPIIHTSKSGSPMERVARSLGLVLVVLVVAWAFWKNNENTIERIQEKSSVVDQTGAMTKDDAKFFVSFGRSLKDKFGMDFKLKVFKGSISTPELDSTTLFIGLSPSTRQAEIVFPPLAAKALGPEFLEYLGQSHFPGYFESDDWIGGAKNAVALIWDQLTTLSMKD